MQKASCRHPSIPKKPPKIQTLLDQTDLLIRRFHLESVKNSVLDRSITDQQALLTDHKRHLQPLVSKQSLARQSALIASLQNELHYARTNLAESTIETEKLKSEVETLRRDMNQDKLYISRTEEEIKAVHRSIEGLVTARKQSERCQESYAREIRRYGSVDRSADLSKVYSNPQSPRRPRKPHHSVSLPKEAFEPPRTDLLRSLVAKWKSNVESQRMAVARYKQYISDLSAGFAVVNGSVPSKTAEEFIAWMNKERVLRMHFNLVQDEVAMVGEKIQWGKDAIRKIAENQSSTPHGQSTGAIPHAAPLLSALVKQTEYHSYHFHSSNDFEILRTIVSEHIEEIKRLGKIYEIRTADKHDHLRGLWEPLTDLKTSFAVAGFQARRQWEDRGYDIEALTELVFNLEESMERFVEFLRVGRYIKKHDQLELSPKLAKTFDYSLPVVPETIDVHHPLTRPEFYKRAAERLSTPYSNAV